MKASELINRITHVVTSHLNGCKNARANCTALSELAEIIRENPVTLRPKCKYPHFASPKPPTWRNRDGEEVLIESMTPAHLANTIAFVKRTRTEQGEEALRALEAEQDKRIAEQMPKWSPEIPPYLTPRR